METILAGQTLTAGTLNAWTPQVLTFAPTAATNFAVSSSTAYWTAGVTWFTVTLTYSGTTLTGGTGGTVASTQCCTLPIAPQGPMFVPYIAHTAVEGLVNIAPSTGVCSLVTLAASATIASGQTVIFSGLILTG